VTFKCCIAHELGVHRLQQVEALRPDEVAHLARALREAGYRVLEAPDGPSARRLAETPGESFDLLVTDVVMPAETGHELAAGLRRARPSLPVVFMSGYSSAGADGQDPADPFLPKPFTPDDLRRAARRALDAPRVVKS